MAPDLRDVLTDTNRDSSQRGHDVLSNVGALDVIATGGIDSVPQSEAVILDGRTSTKIRPIDIAKHVPAAAFALTYVAHRSYRRYRPRRWPVLTPLTLPGLYLFLGSMFTAACYRFSSHLEVVRDRDLFAIDFVAQYYSLATSNDKSVAALFKSAADSLHVKLEEPEFKESREKLKSIRQGNYDAYTPFQKFSWWSNHALHDQKTWNAWAVLLISKAAKQWPTESNKILCSTDIDICATHLANYSVEERECRVNRVLWAAFGTSVPFAMLTRWTGRRILYLPFNGVQRLLLGAIFYQICVVLPSRWDNLKRIRDKELCAALFTELGPLSREKIEEKRNKIVSIFGDEWFD